MTQLSNSQKFKTVTTNLGRNAVALAHATGSSIKLTHMAVGDGNGKNIEPNSTMTALVHEVYRGMINDIVINKNVEGEFTAELLIPQSVGGFFIREVALFFEDDTMFAIGNTPLTEKTELTTGAASDLLVRMIIRVLDAETIEIFIDPAQVLATRDFVERIVGEQIELHDKSETAHAALLKKIVQVKKIAQRIGTHGTWTLVNVIPNKPVFITLDNTAENSFCRFFIKSGANGGNGKTDTFLGYHKEMEERSSNSVTIIPTAPVVVIEIRELTATSTLIASQ